MNIEDRLFNIHDKLKFKGNLKGELPEQLMTLKHLKSSDCVLELGGSCGRNSCIINHILANKKNHVVVEPSTRELSILNENRNNNDFEYHIENSAISDRPLFSKDWYTFYKEIPGSVPVNVISYNQLKIKYQLSFTALIIDNEGHFVNMLKAFPDILCGIKLLIIEHDFNSFDDIDYFNKTMTDHHFYLVDKFLKTDKYGPGKNWSDGVKGDPVFVSVWKNT